MSTLNTVHLGKMVIYVDREKKKHAAMIVGIKDKKVNLNIYQDQPSGMRYLPNVSYAPVSKISSTWYDFWYFAEEEINPVEEAE